jgi:hypothetical protein
MRLSIHIFIFLVAALQALAQKDMEKKNKKDLKAAELAFEKSDFMKAFGLYSKILQSDTTNKEIYYKAGASLIGMNKMDTSSIPYFEKAKTKVPESYFYLGKIYQLTGRSRRALEELYHFKGLNTEETFENNEVNQWIRMCETAIKEEVDKETFIVKNLGSAINSSYPEYVPLVWNVNGSLIFTSRRDNSKGGRKDPYGHFYEDIYIAQKTSEGWTKPESFSDDVNTIDHDACVALSPDGNELIIYRPDETLINGDLYLSKFDGTKWTAPEKMGPEINTEYLETSACFSADGNEIIFSSNRPGGFGGRDLYRIRKFMNGKYCLPYNLGTAVNTAEDEDAPFIDKNNNSLYFSSKGHNSMGEFDIFRSDFNTETLLWMKAENLGIPINSTNDDIYFMKLDDSETAMFSSRRSGGFGDADIYEVNFRESTQLVAYCRINTSIDKEELKDLQLSLYDAETGKLEGLFRPNKNYMAFVLVATKNKPYRIILEGAGIDPLVKRKIFTDEDKEFSIELTGKAK